MELGTIFAKLKLVQTEEVNNFNAETIEFLEKKERELALTEPTPNNPPWNIWLALGVWIMSILFIVIFPNLFVAPYLAKQNLDFSDKARLIEFATTDQTAVILQLLGIIPAHLLTLVLAWFVVTRFKKYSFRQTLGWNWGGFKVWHAIVIFAAFYGLALTLTAIFGEQENDFNKILKSSQTAVFIVAFLATFTAPLVEEVVYRGVLYSALQRKLGIFYGVVAITLLFAVVHVPQYSNNGVPDYVTISIILLLSLVLALVRVRTKNLLPCIVLHTVFNGIQSILMVSKPYLEWLFEHYLQKTQEVPAFIIRFLT